MNIFTDSQKRSLGYHIGLINNLLSKEPVKDLLNNKPYKYYLENVRFDNEEDLDKNIGSLDINTHKFTPYGKDKIKEILKKDYCPHVFIYRKYNTSRINKVQLPYYQVIILFSVRGIYFTSYPFTGHDSRDNFCHAIENIFNDPFGLIHIEESFTSPKYKGYEYSLDICEQRIRYGDSLSQVIKLVISQYNENTSWTEISTMELDDALKAFKITNKDVIKYITDALDNDGIIARDYELIEDSRDYYLRYIPKKEALNKLKSEIELIKNSIKAQAKDEPTTTISVAYKEDN